MYGSSAINVAETGEKYYFCGANAKINSSTAAPTTCSIADSAAITSQITQFGAFGAGNVVSEVYNVSGYICALSSLLSMYVHSFNRLHLSTGYCQCL